MGAHSATVTVLGDPQYEVTNQKPLFRSQVDWILRNPPDLVLCVGDCTDDDKAASWTFLSEQLGRLTTAGIKWVVATGNHDYESSTGTVGLHPLRTTNMNDYLAPPPWAVLRQEGHLESSYSLVDMAGQTFLVLSLEWSPRTATVAWANSVLAAHPGLPAILATHAYMYVDGTRFDYATYGDLQGGSPHNANYQTSPEQGIYDGQELWDALVLPNPNILLVFSGHVSTASVRNDARPDGTRCVQVLSDYQSDPWYSGGWLSQYDVDMSNRVVTARSCSPYYRRSRTAEANSFREHF